MAENIVPAWWMSWIPLVRRVSHSTQYGALTRLDAEVQTITSLTNVQNSLFVPNLGRWVNRRPTYVLRPTASERQSLEEINKILEPARKAQAEAEQEALSKAETQETREARLRRTQSEATLATVATIDSQLSESRYAVLPHGASLDGWSKEDKAELNDHVRHMLHSRRSKFKRSMRGFGQYVRRRRSHPPISPCILLTHSQPWVSWSHCMPL